MRATTLLNRVLKFSGASITKIEYQGSGPTLATVKLTVSKKLSCTHCHLTTKASGSWGHRCITCALQH